MNKISSYKVLSVGGSIIIPKTGFDIKFLKKFRAMILARVKKGEKFVLVIGGGATCRVYQDALKKTIKVNNVDLDWLGIYTTWYNAEFVKLLFGNYAYKDVIKDPENKQILKRVQDDKKSVVIAGGWKPGWSTDKDAVLLAKNLGATEIINLSNIEYVFDKDPNKYKDAKRIERINWPEFRNNIVGYKWVPGKNVPFDPIASGMAQKLRLRVCVLNGNNLAEVGKALNGKKFKGTVIS